MLLQIKKPNNLKFYLILFSLFFVIFLYTSDGHRFTFDEDVASQQSKRIATFSPDPSYVQGESRFFFEYPTLFLAEYNDRPICQNAILCSHGMIMHSLTQVPFVLINHHFNFITDDLIWTMDDFDDFHYVHWRNSLDNDFTFMEFFYAPFFTSLSLVVFFLISKTYCFSVKTSLVLVFLFGLSTIVWAYSQTSLNSVPFIFFILTGFFYYRKFQNTKSTFNLILSSIFFGIAFLTRNDAILFIGTLFVFLLIILIKKNMKLKVIAFSIPVSFSYLIYRFIQAVRIGDGSTQTAANEYVLKGTQSDVPDLLISALVIPKLLYSSLLVHPVHLHAFGLLFSPGAGLFIFSPILILCFVGFFDFYKKYKFDFFLIISFVTIFVAFYSMNVYWHGFNGWATRYLLPTIPFLLLPLGASIEKRTNIFFKVSVIILGITGGIINLVYLLQDVAWFVWGSFGSDSRGLYSLARKSDGNVHDLWINPVIIWTFEFSQITQSALWLIAKPQFDLLLLKMFGPELFVLSFMLIIPVLLFLLLKTSKTFIDSPNNL